MTNKANNMTDNSSPLVIAGGLDKREVLHHLSTAWIAEELQELHVAQTIEQRLDALLDMQGSIAFALSAYEPEELEAARVAFIHAQNVRERPSSISSRLAEIVVEEVIFEITDLEDGLFVRAQAEQALMLKGVQRGWLAPSTDSNDSKKEEEK